MARIKVDGFRCNKCSHEWVARNKKEDPVICPKCKTARWDKDQRYVTKKNS